MRRFLHHFFWLALYVTAFASFSQAQLTLPWSEDFENVGPAKRFNTSQFTLNGLGGFPAPYSWGYFKPLGLEGRVRFDMGAAFANSGTHAATLDDSVNNTIVSPNELILSVDLSNYVNSQINLGFSYMNHGEEQHSGDSVWVRASFIDPWIGVYDLWSNRGALGVYKTVSGINITAALAARGQTPGQFTQIRFGQMDNSPTSSTTGLDGLTIDDVNLSEVAPIDAGISSVDPLNKTCGLAIEPVTVSIQNYGTSVLQDVPVALQVRGTALIVRDTARNLNLSAGQTGSFTFIPGVNLTGYGTYTLVSWTELAADPVTFNDTASRSVTNFTVSSYPFYEDFESGPAGWSSVADPNTTVPSSWTHTSPSLNTINRASSGNFAWVTALGPGAPGSPGGYSDREDSWAIAEQCFDMTTLTQPFLRMDVWWNAESGWDGANVQFSTNGGTTWQSVGNVGTGTNWYNNGSITGQPGGAREGWSGRASSNNGSGGWVTAEHPITGLAGQSDVRFRVAFGSDGSVRDDGFAFDNFLIYEKSAVDAGVDSLLDPLPSGCDLSASQVVTVRVQNLGTAVLNTIPIGYVVDQGPITGPVVLDTIRNANLAAGAARNFSFTTTADLSVPGTYRFRSWASVPNDPNWFNDTLTTTVEHIPVVTVNTANPYFENFEAGSGGWVPKGGGSDPWEYGTPNGGVIRGAASGVNSWMTGLTARYGNSQLGLLESPCFDLSQVLFPLVRMDVWWEIESQGGTWSDGAKMQYSLDGGNTWRDLGTLGKDWYNNPAIPSFTNGGTEGWSGSNADGDGSGGWVSVQTLAANLSLQSSVKFRVYFESNQFTNNLDGFAIDNVEILEAPDDIANLGMPGAAGCNVSDTICIDVFNGSSATFNSITATYRVGNGATIPQTFNVTLNPGDTRRLCFNRPANFPGTGDYDVFTRISAVGNTVARNDTITNRVSYSPVITTYPYFQDFENGAGGWGASSTSFFNSWALRTPALGTINTAASDSMCWVTQSGPTTAAGYLDNECSWVESPCFDFSTVANPRIRMAVNWYSFTQDGMVFQSSIDNGVTWQDVIGTGGINWYNSTNIVGITGCQPTATGAGWAGLQRLGWQNTEIIVPSLALEPQVQFRMYFGSNNISNLDGGAFDDVYIDDQPVRDLSTVAVLEPRDGTCADQNQDITVVIRNEGLNTQTTAPIRYRINNQPDIVYNWTGSLAYNELDTVTIGNFNTFNGGTFTIRVYVDQLIDEQRANDTIEVTVDITPLPPAPTLVADTIALCKADSTLLWVVNPDTNYQYRWYDPNTGDVVAEGDTIQTKFLARDTALLVQAVPDGFPLKITEIEFGADHIEIQNLSNSPLDATGYTVVIGEDNANINTQNVDVWNLGQFNPLEAQWRGDVTGANDWGANMLWNPLPAEGWAMIVNDRCEIVDFVVWGHPITALPNLAATVPGCPGPISLGDDWIGSPLSGTGSFFQRVGNSDNNDASDWQVGPSTTTNRGIQNPGIILPFSGGGGGGGCPSPFARLTILVEPPLNIAVSDQFICGPATLDAGPGFNSYLWSTGQSSQTITYDDTVFTASIIVTDQYGCIGYDTAVIESYPFPDLDLGPDTVACGSIQLDGGSPACDYIWSNGSNDRIINFTGRTGNNLVWTECIDPLTGCASRDSINVNLLPLPNAGLPTFLSICDSGSIAVNPAVAGLPLVWSTGDTVPSIDVKTTNRYYVTMTDTTNGCVGVDSVDLTVGISPKVYLGDDIVACNSATLDAGIFGGFVFYDWSTTQTSQKITVSQSGSYTVKVTDFNQCSDSDTINVDILPPPSSSWVSGITPGTLSGLDLDFVNLANGIGLTYDWDFGDGNNSTNEDPSHTFQFPGFYIVCLTVTDSCGNADQYCDTLDLPLVNTTSIELEVLENAVSIFPTPTRDLLNIEISGLEADAILEVTDIRGRLLERVSMPRRAGTQLSKIDMSDKAEGVYFVTVIAEGQKIVRKIMKE